MSDYYSKYRYAEILKKTDAKIGTENTGNLK